MNKRNIRKMSNEELTHRYQCCAGSGCRDMKRRTKEYRKEMRRRKLPIPHVNMCFGGKHKGVVR